MKVSDAALSDSVTSLVRAAHLDKLWGFMRGDHPWVAPAFLAAGAMPALGLILARHNEARKARENFPSGYPYGSAHYPPAPEEIAEESRRAVKLAMLKASVSIDQPLLKGSQPTDGLDHLREMLREAKSRTGRMGAPALSFRGGAEDSYRGI